MLHFRLSRLWSGSLRATSCLLLGAALLVAHSGHAFAQEDDDDDLTFEQKIIRNLMGGMGAAGTGAGIEYRERSPLVIPPARDLPPPEAQTTAAPPTANWPNDPEKRRRVVKKDKKPMNARELATWNDPGRALTPDELRAGRISGSGASTVTRPGNSASETEGGRPLLPSMLGYTGGVFGSLWGNVAGPKEETAPFEGEPARTTLTAPPTGYMTPSPNQPYGLGQQRIAPVRPMSPADLPARGN